MKSARKGNLYLASNVVEMLIPQRRPFLMIDFVDSFSAAPRPTIEAGRHISANEIYFAGHFPGLHLWPGSLTIEGIGQTAAALMTLLVMRRTAESEGRDPDAPLEELRNLQLGYQLHPGFRPANAAQFVTWLESLSPALAVGAAVDVKLHRPVFAGQRLDYRVSIATEVGEMMRFDVEASVDGTPVASGVLTGARMLRPPAVGPRA